MGLECVKWIYSFSRTKAMKKILFKKQESVCFVKIR
jgi:hypothetical protein